MAPQLSSGCGVCGKKQGLLRCAGCQVMFYCGREHQALDRPAHKSACNNVKKSRSTLASKEQTLRNLPGFQSTDSDPLARLERPWDRTGAPMRYMTARSDLAQEMSSIKTVQSVQAQLAHSMAILRVFREYASLRFAIPGLMLRLGQDNACYDFVKWWTVCNDNDWVNPKLPYLSINNADVLEPVDWVDVRYSNLSGTIAVTLLKIKLLLEIRTLNAASSALQFIFPTLPEIVDIILSSVSQSSAVPAKMTCSENHPIDTRELEDQINQLYAKVNIANDCFWSALVNPREYLLAHQGSLDRLSVSVLNMHSLLKASCASWDETPGAIEFIKAKITSNM